MLLFGLIALLLLFPTLSIHFWQHFQFQCGEPDEDDQATTHETQKSFTKSFDFPFKRRSRFMNKCSQCISFICFIKPIDDSTFFFFPLSFLLYIMFVIFLTIILCITEASNNGSTLSNINLLSIYYNKSALFNLHVHFMDDVYGYIEVYGVMTLSIWESLFSFYRFYTTFISTTETYIISTKEILKKFSIYIVIYSSVYIIFVHLFYWLFPVVVSIHIIFNFYCNIKFARLLYDKYQLFSEIAGNVDEFRKNKCQLMLNTVRYIERASLICCVLQSIYLTLFIIFYNVSTTVGITLLCSFNCLIFTFNFSRNRQCIQSLLNYGDQDEDDEDHLNTTIKLTRSKETTVPSHSNVFNNKEEQRERIASDDDNMYAPSVIKKESVSQSVDIIFEPQSTERDKTLSNIKEESEEMCLNDRAESVREAMFSMDILTTYGFCSRRNLHEMNVLIQQEEGIVITSGRMIKASTEKVASHQKRLKPNPNRSQNVKKSRSLFG